MLIVILIVLLCYTWQSLARLDRTHFFNWYSDRDIHHNDGSFWFIIKEAVMISLVSTRMITSLLMKKSHFNWVEKVRPVI